MFRGSQPSARECMDRGRELSKQIFGVPSRLGAEVPFVWRLNTAVALDAAIDLPADERHPPAVDLRLRLELAASAEPAVRSVLDALG